MSKMRSDLQHRKCLMSSSLCASSMIAEKMHRHCRSHDNGDKSTDGQPSQLIDVSLSTLFKSFRSSHSLPPLRTCSLSYYHCPVPITMNHLASDSSMQFISNSSTRAAIFEDSTRCFVFTSFFLKRNLFTISILHLFLHLFRYFNVFRFTSTFHFSRFQTFVLDLFRCVSSRTFHFRSFCSYFCHFLRFNTIFRSFHSNCSSLRSIKTWAFDLDAFVISLVNFYSIGSPLLLLFSFSSLPSSFGAVICYSVKRSMHSNDSITSTQIQSSHRSWSLFISTFTIAANRLVTIFRSTIDYCRSHDIARSPSICRRPSCFTFTTLARLVLSSLLIQCCLFSMITCLDRKLSNRIVNTKYGALRGHVISLASLRLDNVETFYGKTLFLFCLVCLLVCSFCVG